MHHDILLSGEARECFLHSVGYLPKISDWEQIFKLVKDTPNLNGAGKMRFAPNLIWIVKHDNIKKIKAGTFGETDSEKEEREKKWAKELCDRLNANNGFNSVEQKQEEESCSQDFKIDLFQKLNSD